MVLADAAHVSHAFCKLAIFLGLIALAAGTEARCWQYSAGIPARLHCLAVFYELEAQVL